MAVLSLACNTSRRNSDFLPSVLQHLWGNILDRSNKFCASVHQGRAQGSCTQYLDKTPQKEVSKVLYLVISRPWDWSNFPHIICWESSCPKKSSRTIMSQCGGCTILLKYQDLADVAASEEGMSRVYCCFQQRRKSNNFSV
ncbi:hypothetical protein AVEN_96358-1 [Araneus ventricosus]|uniref:Uncharacterized protein n=1 Tax=Araneus ventricosus TaxID=182803 RepID=A0A4Y2VL12_ARAVE|nr:hypothetical protein AVEN_96358-1 [Araneus ventricosus]